MINREEHLKKMNTQNQIKSNKLARKLAWSHRKRSKQISDTTFPVEFINLEESKFDENIKLES
jgi:hypothetical protein